MHSTYQFENIDMLAHGKMVSESYSNLLLEYNVNNYDYFTNIFGIKDIEFIKYLFNNQYDHEVMENYHIYHDCGKPHCREIDSNGRQHFPNHAQVSSNIYSQYFDCKEIENLISNDMCFHTYKGEELQNWLADNKANTHMLCSLYLTAWAEIIANSSMFGGFDSTSFKIKRKALISPGKKLYALKG